MTKPLRAALYLRVSTARQSEHEVSIPDQRRQDGSFRNHGTLLSLPVLVAGKKRRI